MPVSKALENSAKDFNTKYACKFDFTTFESRVEEFTFLRPNNGWIDVYKMTFDQMYKRSLESVDVGTLKDLNGEEMLDDFEYTLIRPYVSEGESKIKHKPYVGMDRIARLEYLKRITREAPDNPVGLYEEKYKKGELSLSQMSKRARSILELKDAPMEDYVEVAGYVQALERANKGRSFIWRAIHPRKDRAERMGSVVIKNMLIEGASGRADVYEKIALSANEEFKGHKIVNANLEQSMAHATEENNRLQKINDAMRESLFIGELSNESERERSARVDQYKNPTREKQI